MPRSANTAKWKAVYTRIAPKTMCLVSGVGSPNSTTCPRRLGVWNGWPAMESRSRNQSATANPPMMPTSVPSDQIECELSSIPASGSRSTGFTLGPECPERKRGYRLAAWHSRRVRWWFHFGAERGPIKGAPESGMPPPEQESHRAEAQDTPADCCRPRQPLTGQIGQHDEVPEEQKEPDHQPKPDAHPK